MVNPSIGVPHPSASFTEGGRKGNLVMLWDKCDRGFPPTLRLAQGKLLSPKDGDEGGHPAFANDLDCFPVKWASLT